MKKVNIIALAILAVAGLTFTSCDDLFEPAQENNLGLDHMYNDAGYAEGVLGNAYTRIPCGSFPFSEVATDDAVSNDPSNSWRKAASGTWTADANPTERWRDCRAAIMYINLFLDRADKVHWADDQMAAKMFNDREKGEAYGLRAMFMYYLLQAHGGVDANGQLMGVPIITESEDVNSEHNLPRNTFAECMKAIYDDCDKALEFYQENGNIYAIPYGMTILAMMGSKTYLEEREGWNLEEYKDFIDSLPNQMMATKGISKQEMLTILCIQYMTHFVDTSNGKCDFQTEEFRNLLEFVNYYPSQGANVNEIAAMFEEIQEGGIILIPAVLQDVHSYELYRALFSDGAQMIGYPTENKKGITLVPVGKTLAMISTGSHKPVAWDFVKYSMVNKTIGFEVFYSFRPFYNELIAEARDNADSDEMAMHVPLGSINLEVPHASLREIDALEKMLLNGNVARIGDEAIIKIISEEAEAFFNGNKNIEQVTEIIQNRVKLFVAE